MKFTDYDLKWLRNEMGHTCHYPKLRALLQRLEAAERIPGSLDALRYGDGRLPIRPGPELDELEQDINAWKESKGE